MKIQFDQSEIEAAIKERIQGLGNLTQIGNIDFTAGRGSSGITAEMEVSLEPVQLDVPTGPVNRGLNEVGGSVAIAHVSEPAPEEGATIAEGVEAVETDRLFG